MMKMKARVHGSKDQDCIVLTKKVNDFVNKGGLGEFDSVVDSVSLDSDANNKAKDTKFRDYSDCMYFRLKMFIFSGKLNMHRKLLTCTAAMTVPEVV